MRLDEAHRDHKSQQEPQYKNSLATQASFDCTAAGLHELPSLLTTVEITLIFHIVVFAWRQVLLSLKTFPCEV